MNPFKQIESILNVSLSEIFKNFLISWNPNHRLLLSSTYDKKWEVCSPASLLLERNGFPFYSSLDFYSSINSDLCEADEKFKELIAFAEENSDLLLYKPKDNSIWVYWLDGSKLEKLYVNFEYFLKSSSVYEEFVDELETSKDKNLIGEWHPFSSENADLELHTAFKLKAEGKYDILSMTGEVMSDLEWGTQDAKLILKDPYGDFVYNIVNKNDAEMVLQGPVPETDIVRYLKKNTHTFN